MKPSLPVAFVPARNCWNWYHLQERIPLGDKTSNNLSLMAPFLPLQRLLHSCGIQASGQAAARSHNLSLPAQANIIVSRISNPTSLRLQPRRTYTSHINLSCGIRVYHHQKCLDSSDSSEVEELLVGVPPAPPPVFSCSLPYSSGWLMQQIFMLRLRLGTMRPL